MGFVVDCNGTHAVITADVNPQNGELDTHWAVGQLVSIKCGGNRIVGQCFKVEAPAGHWQSGAANQVLVHMELVGEIQEREGSPKFSSGITGYPSMGSIAHRIRAGDLEAIYDNTSTNTIRIGHLTQENSIPAQIDLDKLLTRHFAVVGSTGVGKSTAVSLILREVVEKRDDLRVIILDPHNEFACSFEEKVLVRDARTLHLPFWLFRFAEFADVIFRGQKGLDSETELLRDLVADAKERFAEEDAEPGKLARRIHDRNGYTADSPVPYRIMDLIKIIDERLGQLDGKQEKPILKSLRDRIGTISRDPRFQFMFGQSSAGGDRLKTVLSEIFRVPKYGKPISVIEMSALPSEVVNSVASVLCRLAFDLAMASNGAVQTLVVCEEAHRYIPADPDAGFWPTRQAVARIAKEGRKYGVYLAIITQRPSELDPTILSQCNTVFAMRLSNRADQQIIGGAITNGAQSTVGFLASIQNRECIAFGEAINTPMRMTFETIANELLPGRNIQKIQSAVRDGMEVDLNSVVKRMRDGQEYSDDEVIAVAQNKAPANLPQREITPAVVNNVQMNNPVPGLEENREEIHHAAALTNGNNGSQAKIFPAPEPPPFVPPGKERDSRKSEASRLLESFRTRK